LDIVGSVRSCASRARHLKSRFTPS